MSDPDVPENPDAPENQPPEGRVRIRILRRIPIFQEINIPQLYPVVWHGILGLKMDRAAVMLHYVSGNKHIPMQIKTIKDRCFQDKRLSPLRIRQRRRFAVFPMDNIRQRLQENSKHCILLALPCGTNTSDLAQQACNLERGFIKYFNKHQAAGIICETPVGSAEPTFVMHFFPPCEFTEESLSGHPSDVLQIVRNTTPLVVIITAAV